MNIAIIPARSGSKRINNKNIKDFFGKPIIAYSIEEALKSGVFDKVIVSTDSSDIASISKQYGAEVPFIRPIELSDDYCGISDVMSHAVKYLQSNHYSINNVCCIYATAPFIKSTDIICGLERLMLDAVDYVLSIGEFESSVKRSLIHKPGSGLSMLFSEDNFFTRSQDFEKVYFDAGQFCWGRKNAWLHNKRIFNNNTGFIKIPSHRVLDIDTNEDWQKSELIYQVNRMKENE